MKSFGSISSRTHSRNYSTVLDDALMNKPVFPEPNILIPKIIWMTMKTSNVTGVQPPRITKFRARNPDWKFHLLDDNAIDHFMAREFRNTSLLWAYQLINPILGALRADIWRLAALWKYGGFYIDYDAYIATPLNEVLQTEDEIILSTENNPFTNRYLPVVPWQKIDREKLKLFDHKIILNWAIFSKPGHPFLRRTIENLVTAVKWTYYKKPFLIMELVKERYILGLTTTGPELMTASICQELVAHPEVRFRYTPSDFKAYGGVYKHHEVGPNLMGYGFLLERDKQPFLSKYSNSSLD